MDLIITRSNEEIASNFSIYDPVISDQFAVHCNLSIQSPQNPAVTITYRKLRAINFDVLRQDIADSPLCLSDQPSLSIDERCIQYHTLLTSILEKHAPLKTKAIILRPHAPWYTDDIRVQKSRRRRLEGRWRLSKLSSDRKFVDLCELVKNLVFNAKMNFYSTLISNASSNSKVLFKMIDRFLHRKLEKRLPYCVSLAELADRFAIFFMEKIDSLRNDLPVVDFPNYFHEIDNPILSWRRVNFSPATLDELSHMARHIGRKSCSLDPLPSNVFLSQLDLLLPVLYDTVNRSSESSIFPHSLKSAVVTPLLKKASLNHEVLRNYRPVSNLNVVSKIVEKVVASRLVLNHLNEPLQSG